MFINGGTNPVSGNPGTVTPTTTFAIAVSRTVTPLGPVPVAVAVLVTVAETVWVQRYVHISSKSSRESLFLSPDRNFTALHLLSLSVTFLITTSPILVTLYVYVTEPAPLGKDKGFGILVTLISGAGSEPPLPPFEELDVVELDVVDSVVSSVAPQDGTLMVSVVVEIVPPNAKARPVHVMVLPIVIPASSMSVPANVELAPSVVAPVGVQKTSHAEAPPANVTTELATVVSAPFILKM
jgi:hypothetical protein